MNVLVVGGGGREHVLAWKAAQSRQVEIVYVAPGNAGTATEDKLANIAISAEDTDGLVAFARKERIDLTIIGPEAPLVAGIVDTFDAAGLRCFGPAITAAVLEGSKSFAKEFLKRHKIPTADYQIFTETDPAIRYICDKGIPIVIKADGLAAGKGVVIALNEQEAITAVTDMLSSNKFGEAGQRIVIEEFLSGEEASFIVMTDGEHILPLASSQDHKARDDGDRGPNTGGMGAYSPAPVITRNIHDRIMRDVIAPTVRGMAEEGRKYVGFLYTGLMITPDGTPKVLEFNCRFGDPEAQPIIMRLKSDLVELCVAALDGKLNEVNAEWDKRAALGVVLASAGYPVSATKGDVITGLNSAFPENVKIFHAGTAVIDGQIVTAGGRVLCATVLGANVTQAQKAAYQAIAKINWDGMFYRRDIGYRAVAREQDQA
ncbi:MAG: phosphoribosylamine--glycine ligase [Gammaproteobacteria bacterium]|nr:phosphoribosylamine--glycine ligase [Gammaproteobacteria bacterium]